MPSIDELKKDAERKRQEAEDLEKEANQQQEKADKAKKEYRICEQLKGNLQKRSTRRSSKITLQKF